MFVYYILKNYPIDEARSLLHLVQPVYYSLIFLGGLISWILIYRRLIQGDYDRKKLRVFMITAGVVGLLSVIFGSRFFRMFYEPSSQWSAGFYWETFCGGGFFGFGHGKETFHGSLFLLFFSMLLVVYIFNKTNYLRLRYAEIIDLGALYMPLHIFFGRTGCFMAGCCWGGEGQITLFGNTYAFNHPAPLYEMIYGVCFFVILRYVYNKIYASPEKNVYSGMITALAALSYGIFRFIVENVRTEPVVLWGMTQAQIAMILMVIFGIAVLAWIFWKRYSIAWE